MSSNTKTSKVLGLALLTLTVLSCKKETADPPVGGGDKGNVTTATPAASPAAPTASSGPSVPTGVVPVPTGTNPETVPMGAIEAPAALPSPAVLQAVSGVQGTLDGLAASVAGTKVRFVDCSETASCTTRLEAKTLTGLRDLLQAVSKDQGGITFVAREQLDAYTGQSFVADVTLGAAQARAVPTDENALLIANDGS
jgi:hypothetical protein